MQLLKPFVPCIICARSICCPGDDAERVRLLPVTVSRTAYNMPIDNWLICRSEQERRWWRRRSIGDRNVVFVQSTIDRREDPCSAPSVRPPGRPAGRPAIGPQTGSWRSIAAPRGLHVPSVRSPTRFEGGCSRETTTMSRIRWLRCSPLGGVYGWNVGRILYLHNTPYCIESIDYIVISVCSICIGCLRHTHTHRQTRACTHA